MEVKIIGEIKQDLINHFDLTKNGIDLYSQSQLSSNEKLLSDSNVKDKFWNVYQNLIAKVDEIFERNIAKINNSKTTNFKNDKELIKQDIIDSYCYFIDNNSLKPNFKNNFLVGILIVTDWYLNQNEIAYLRILFCDKNNRLDIKINYDEKILVLKHVYDTYEFEEENKDCIINIKRDEIIQQLSILDELIIKFEPDRLGCLKKNIFKNLNNLNGLVLNNIEFESIENGVFDSLKNVKSLSLLLEKYDENFGDENFDNIPVKVAEKSFENLINAINCLNNLEELNFFQFIRNQEFYFTFSLQNLKTLNISYVSFDKIYRNLLANLKNLSELNVNFSKVKEIEDSSFNNLKKLKRLNLGNNKIVKINRNTFEGLESLDVLVLNQNLIQQIDSKVFESLRNLRQLNLSDNRIKKLNENSFEGMNNLEWLDLSKNQISNLNVNLFKSLKKLYNLNLSMNSIVSFETNVFNGLENLGNLSLAFNKISNFDSNIMKPFIKLEQLDLSGNHFDIINDNLFVNLKNLKNLALNEMESLHTFQPRSFFGLENLESLSIKYSSIKCLSNDLFIFVKNLKFLYLSGNQIKSLNSETFNGLQNLEFLDVCDNPIETLGDDFNKDSIKEYLKLNNLTYFNI